MILLGRLLLVCFLQRVAAARKILEHIIEMGSLGFWKIHFSIEISVWVSHIPWCKARVEGRPQTNISAYSISKPA